MTLTFEEFCADSALINEPISAAWADAFRKFDEGAWHQLCAVKGRRAGGTRTALKYLIFKAHTSDFQRFAPPGERLFVPVILQDRGIARETMNTLAGFYQNSRVLGGEVTAMYRNQIALHNGIVYSVVTCSYRAPRGVAAPLGLCDEIGVWRQQGSDIDREVVRSLTPAQVQFPTRKLILLGTPWVRSGILFERWERRGEGGDCLVVHMPTALGNPLIPSEELEKERAADPQNFSREFEALWSADLEQFLPESDITAAVAPWRETPPRPEPRYIAALDASGLSGGDRFCFAVAHGESGKPGAGAVDVLRGWRRAAVPRVLDEVAALAKAYRIARVIADQYSFSFVQELLRQRGVALEQLAFSARSKPEVFFSLKTALAQGSLQIPNNAQAVGELRALESLRTSGGNYKIGAPRGQHDDFVTVLALLAHRLARPRREPVVEFVPAARPTSKPLAPGDAGPERWWRRI
jgi:hypothetical protein